MKDVLYKAGEMESDGLEEWDEGSKAKRGKKSCAKRSVKVESSSSGCDSPRQSSNVGPRARPMTKEKQTIPSRRLKISNPLTGQGPSITASALAGYHIPKKVQQEFPQCWTEEENSAGQALLHLSAESAKSSLDERMRKPQVSASAQQQRPSHPPTLVRYAPANGSPQVGKLSAAASPPLLMAGPSGAMPPQPAAGSSTASAAGSTQRNSAASSQQRRARKQMSPRKDAGLTFVPSRL